MTEGKRRHFSGPEKVQILKRHLVEKVPVSDLCDEYNLYPTQVYAWLKEFFENGHAAFDRNTGGHSLYCARQLDLWRGLVDQANRTCVRQHEPRADDKQL